MTTENKYPENNIEIKPKEEDPHPIIKRIIDGGFYPDRMAVVADFNKLIDEELISSGQANIVNEMAENEELASLYFEYNEKRILEEKERGTFKKGITNSLKKGFLRNALAISLFSNEEIPENFQITKEMIAEEIANIFPELMEIIAEKATYEAYLSVANNNKPLTEMQSIEWIDRLSTYQDLKNFIKDIQRKYGISNDDYMSKFEQRVKDKNIQPTNKTIN